MFVYITNFDAFLQCVLPFSSRKTKQNMFCSCAFVVFKMQTMYVW